MPHCLNHDLQFADLPVEHQEAFTGLHHEKRLFQPATEFYKYTQGQLFDNQERVSPWWFSVKPLSSDDPGLEGLLEYANRLNVSPEHYARVRGAVSQHWNTMSGLLKMHLIRPVYGFVGICSHQRIDDTSENSNVVFIGGATQAYLPNLTRQTVARS